MANQHISPEVLEWARREAGSHHSRCATGHDKGCDCYNSNPQRGHYVFAHAVVSLFEQLESLVTLVRIGFLVTVNGEKGRTDVVNDPELRKLLFTILQAQDIAAAISAVASSPASVRHTGAGPEQLLPPGQRTPAPATATSSGAAGTPIPSASLLPDRESGAAPDPAKRPT